MKKLLSSFKYVLLCTVLATSIVACSKDDDKKDEPDPVKEVENFVGTWDATELFYVMSGNEYNVDDLIANFSEPKEGETEEEKAKREEILGSLQNEKGIFEDLWKAEINEDGTGVVTYEGHIPDWNDSAVWSKNDDGTYAFTYGEGEYKTPTTLTLESETAGYFIIKGESLDYKVLVTKIQ